MGAPRCARLVRLPSASVTLLLVPSYLREQFNFKTPQLEKIRSDMALWKDYVECPMTLEILWITDPPEDKEDAPPVCVTAWYTHLAQQDFYLMHSALGAVLSHMNPHKVHSPRRSPRPFFAFVVLVYRRRARWLSSGASCTRRPRVRRQTRLQASLVFASCTSSSPFTFVHCTLCSGRCRRTR